MTGTELGFCIAAAISSSLSQLILKFGTSAASLVKRLFLFSFAGMMLALSVLLVVLALRSIHLSQLVPFAALAYILVPIGSHYLLGEKLTPRFWVGALLIAAGIIVAS